MSTSKKTSEFNKNACVIIVIHIFMKTISSLRILPIIVPFTRLIFFFLFFDSSNSIITTQQI